MAVADVHNVLREVVHSNICPSNGTIARKFKKRYPDNEHSLLFNIHLNYPPACQSPPVYNPFTAHWGQTLEWVLGERGEDISEFMSALAAGDVGIAV